MHILMHYCIYASTRLWKRDQVLQTVGRICSFPLISHHWAEEVVELCLCNCFSSGFVQYLSYSAFTVYCESYSSGFFEKLSYRASVVSHLYFLEESL